MKELQLKVISNRGIAKNIYEMEFELPQGLLLKSGQFINISTGSSQHLLRRPIAIAGFSQDKFSICYQIKGSGTQSLQRVQAGEKLSSVLPLGNFFKVEKNFKRVAILGGGVGIFPLVALLKEYHKSLEFYSYIGFRNAAYVCKEKEFQALSKKVIFTTDDGSFAKQGNIVDAFVSDLLEQKFDAIYACGPLPMLRALKDKVKECNINLPCYVSLEERMGCGIGACLVCVCKKANVDKNVRVCKDGPIFEIHEVEL